ncbi:MAG: LysR substrate-binding domain-containing protein [Streptosporangiaceae bacterium]
MSELTVSGLRVVREIALSGSFTAAARLLGYSQSAISRQVGAIEAAAGHPLFVRQARGARVTPAGAIVVEHAGRILASVDALGQDLAGLGDRLAGRIKLGAFPAAMAVLAPRAVALLRSEHPGLEVSLSEAGTPSLLRQLGAGRLGVAVIGVGAGLPDYDLAGLEHEIVLAGGLRVAVPHGHRLAQAGLVAVAELAGEPWIAGDDSGGDPQFRAWPTLADPVIRYTVRGWPARFGLVAAGLGICLVPEIAALSVPAGVTTIGVEDPGWLGRMTVAVTPRERTAETAAIVDALRRTGDDIHADIQLRRPDVLAHATGDR